MNFNTKRVEAKLHEELYNNIKLLSNIHPTTPELDSVLRKDMFVKSNKAAFQQVIYYLFTVLNVQLTKEKITSWPLYDPKMEFTFRNEVVAFLEMINNKYEESTLPKIMASQLVVPGGFKFVDFMLTLSNFVIYMDLKRNKMISSEVVAPVRPHNKHLVTDTILRNLKGVTCIKETRNHELWKKFQDKFDSALLQAEKIVEEQNQVEAEISKAKKNLRDKKQKKNHSQRLFERLNELKNALSSLEKIKVLCQNGSKLLRYLEEDKIVLEFERQTFQAPDSVKHLFKNDKLDVVLLFNSLSSLLDTDVLEFPTYSEEQLKNWIKLFVELNEKCDSFKQRYEANEKELQELMESFQLNVK